MPPHRPLIRLRPLVVPLKQLDQAIASRGVSRLPGGGLVSVAFVVRARHLRNPLGCDAKRCAARRGGALRGGAGKLLGCVACGDALADPVVNF
jgi:hypothetical protein